MKTFIKILLFILGFPALIGLAVYSSINIFQEGQSYGFLTFAGVIVLALFFVAYLITFIVTEVKSKKSKSKKIAQKGMVALVLVAFIFTGGLWIIIDVLLPDILDDATSGTLLFDDVRENYKVQAQVNGQLLEDFIIRNYQNENLDNSVALETYLQEGYRNERVKLLIHENFTSLDTNGYGAFTSTGPWVGLADGDRLTIPVLVHLLFNEKEIDETLPFYLEFDRIPKEIVYDDMDPEDYYYNNVERDDPEAGVTWSVLDMAGSPMEISLGGMLVDMDPGLRTLVLSLIQTLGPSLVGTLRDIVADPAVAGAPIYLGIKIGREDIENTGIILMPSNESRGVLDYKANAWLDSNNLLFAVISIFPIRFWLYLWGAIVIAMSVAIGAIRMKEAKEDDDFQDEEADYNNTYREFKHTEYDDSDLDDPNLSPYEKAYFKAQRERIRRA
ncbi:MAG: hypothetical protein PHG90_01975 [Clostridia bacterium]|nr:hypothetical protein [Clostridia bacterium]